MAKPKIGFYNEHYAGSLSLSAGDPVTSWPDLTGNGLHLAEATNAPTYRAASGDFLVPHVEFDGVNDKLSNSHADVSTGMTFVFIGKFYSSVNQQAIASHFGSVESVFCAIRATSHADANKLVTFRGASLTGSALVAAAGGKLGMLVIRLDATQSELYRGVVKTAGGGVGTRVWNDGQIIGCSNTTGGYADFARMDLAYYACRKGALSYEEIVKLWSWAQTEVFAASALPSGAVAITSVTPGPLHAAVSYTYSGSDDVLIEARVEGGTAFAVGNSPAKFGAVPDVAYTTGVELRATNAVGSTGWTTASPFTTTSSLVGYDEFKAISDGVLYGPAPGALYSDGKLFVSTVNVSGETYLHRFGAGGAESAIVAAFPLDVHNNASLAVDSSGYIYIAAVHHVTSTSITIKKSTTANGLDFSNLSAISNGSSEISYPAINIDTAGRIWVFFTSGNATRDLKYTYSDDGGSTWAALVTLWDAVAARAYFNFYFIGNEIVCVGANDNADDGSDGTVSGFFMVYSSGSWRDANGNAYTLPVTTTNGQKYYDVSTGLLNHGFSAAVERTESGWVVYYPVQNNGATDVERWASVFDGTSWSQAEIISNAAGATTAAWIKDTTADFSFFSTGDVSGTDQVVRWYSTDSGATWAKEALTTAAPVNQKRSLSPIAGALPDGAPGFVYLDSFRNSNTSFGGDLYTPLRPVVSTGPSIPDDDTAPAITDATATATGPTTATASVTTDDGNGTLYFLASTNVTESAATVKAALSQSVTADGEQSIGLSALDPETTYYVHFVQINGASLESASVVTTNAITTPAIVYPEISATAAASSTSAVSATATTDTAGGTIYGVLSESATVMEAADIKSGANDTATVTGAGDYTLDETGLSTWTQYYWHIVHEDADGLMSNVLTIQVRTLDISIPLSFSDTAPATLLTVQVWSKVPTQAEVEGLY